MKFASLVWMMSALKRALILYISVMSKVKRLKHLRDTAIFQFILSFLNLAFLDMLSNNEKIKTTNQNVFFPS